MTDAEQIILAGGTPAEFFNDTDYKDAINGMDGAIERVLRRTRSRGRSSKPNHNSLVAQAVKEVGARSKRMQVLQRISQLPKGVQTQLLNKRLQIVDHTLYSIAAINAKTTVDLIHTAKNEEHGYRNLSNAKHKHHFLLQEIVLLYSNAADEISGNYSQALPPAMINGDFKLTINGSTVFDRLPIATLATNDSNSEGYINRFKMDTPKWIFESKQVEAQIMSPAALPAGFVKILMIGQEIRPL